MAQRLSWRVSSSSPSWASAWPPTSCALRQSSNALKQDQRVSGSCLAWLRPALGIPVPASADSNAYHWLSLTHRAEKGRASGLHHALDDAVAAPCRTMLALAIVDAEIVLEQAKLAVGLFVVAQRGAAGLDGILQHCFDRLHQPLGALVGRTRTRRNGRSAALG